MTEICTIFTFTHVRQTCFAYNFFWCIFLKFFQLIQNQREILRVLISFFFQKFLYFGHSSTFENFEVKRAKNGSRKIKTYLVNVS
jgi:hypothetical protein